MSWSCPGHGLGSLLGRFKGYGSGVTDWAPWPDKALWQEVYRIDHRFSFDTFSRPLGLRVSISVLEKTAFYSAT